MDPLSLSQLNQTIKNILGKHLESSYWVIAEIGELRLNQKGHCYLDLIEKENELMVAKSRATIWSYTFRNINGWFEAITGSPLTQGMKILANIQVNFHEIYGFSLNIRDIDPKFTLGERERQKQETIQKLIDDGVFEMNKMHSLPKVPQRLAVISASTAAGFGDFMNQLDLSGFHFDVRFFNVTLQGDKAPGEIIHALHQILAEDIFDAVIIIRGGGPQVDLDTFNDYELCSHVAQFPMPVITGIGHERDETIADMVAHTRMKTPTAAADFLIGAFIAFEDDLLEFKDRIYRNVEYRLNGHLNTLQLLTEKIKSYAVQHYQNQYVVLRTTGQRIEAVTKYILQRHHEKIAQLWLATQKQSLHFVDQQNSLLKYKRDLLRVSAPDQILKRGFTISRINGKSIPSLSNISPGSTLETLSSQGTIISTINIAKKAHGKEEN